MVKVYVWNFLGKDVAWGHASVEVDGGALVGTEYISWWPESTGRRVKAIHENLYCVGAIPNRTYVDDVKAEESLPHHVVRLPGAVRGLAGLDEAAITRWWRRLRDNGTTDWCSLGPNCSTIAAYALAQGGADEFADWFSGNNLFWKPDLVLKYSVAVADGIASARSRPQPSELQLDGGLPPGGV